MTINLLNQSNWICGYVVSIVLCIVNVSLLVGLLSLFEVVARKL